MLPPVLLDSRRETWTTSTTSMKKEDSAVSDPFCLLTLSRSVFFGGQDRDRRAKALRDAREEQRWRGDGSGARLALPSGQRPRHGACESLERSSSPLSAFASSLPRPRLASLHEISRRRASPTNEVERDDERRTRHRRPASGLPNNSNAPLPMCETSRRELHRVSTINRGGD